MRKIAQIFVCFSESPNLPEWLDNFPDFPVLPDGQVAVNSIIRNILQKLSNLGTKIILRFAAQKYITLNLLVSWIINFTYSINGFYRTYVLANHISGKACPHLMKWLNINLDTNVTKAIFFFKWLGMYIFCDLFLYFRWNLWSLVVKEEL